MMNFEQIDEARTILGLAEEATMEEIKVAYRSLALKYHPDKCKNKDKKLCEEIFKKINRANEIILEYCANYRYSFKDEKINEDSPEDGAHIKRFYDDWFGGVDK
jgi:DnaJ-class molecular chaperone